MMKEPEHPAWLVWFEDADLKPLIFVGETAEEYARETARQRSVFWNLHLFKEVEQW